MNNIDLVQYVTNELCKNDHDLKVLDECFDPNFTFNSNGNSGNLADLPHAFYVFAGACGAIFCVPNECKRTTGIDPGSKAAIKRHADYLARMMVLE
jgi:hypothetical protein